MDALAVLTDSALRLSDRRPRVVVLSEMRPEGVQRITQTVTTEKIDGKWFVDVFR